MIKVTKVIKAACCLVHSVLRQCFDQKLKYIKGLPAEIEEKYTLIQNTMKSSAMTTGFLLFHTSRL